MAARGDGAAGATGAPVDAQPAGAAGTAGGQHLEQPAATAGPAAPPLKPGPPAPPMPPAPNSPAAPPSPPSPPVPVFPTPPGPPRRRSRTAARRPRRPRQPRRCPGRHPRPHPPRRCRIAPRLHLGRRPGRRPGPAGPAVAVQQPAGPAGLPGPRCAVGAVADQRTPQQQLGGRVHNVEQALQRRRGGGLSARVRASARSKGLNELGMKRRHLSAHRLIGLAMRGEQRRDGRRHLISTGCQKFRRRAQCRGVGGPQRRPDVRQIRSGPHQRLGSGDYKRHAFLRSAVRRVSSSS